MNTIATTTVAASQFVKVNPFTDSWFLLVVGAIVTIICIISVFIGFGMFKDGGDGTGIFIAIAAICLPVLLFAQLIPGSNLKSGISEVAETAGVVWVDPMPKANLHLEAGIYCSSDEGEQYNVLHADGTIEPTALNVVKSDGTYHFSLVSTDKCQDAKS